MYPGGASFETHVSTSKNKSIFKFIPSIKYALYTIMYLFLCIGCYFLGIELFFIDNGLSVIGLLLLGAAIVFLVAFVYFIKDYLKSIVFNKTTGIYHKGYFNIRFLRNDKAHLDDIIALQILGEITTEQIAPFNSYELNLVLKDYERIHVIDHADIKNLLEDVEHLSKFLDVPILTNKSDED
jgi:hypothetical protein